MLAYRKHTGIAVAIAALMVLSTLSGLAAAAPHPSSGASTAPHTAISAHPSLSSPTLGLPSTGGATITATHPGAPSGILAAPTAPVTASGAAPSDRTLTTLSTLRADGVPLRDAFLPNLNTNPHPTLSPYGTVTPSYTTGPAPIGVAEYGVYNDSGVLTPENLSTTTLLGTFTGYNEFCVEVDQCTPSVLAMDSGAPDSYGIQLNAVLQNVTLFNTPGYEFWTQNVIEYSTYSHQLYLITNIWNFSSPAVDFTPNALAGHGPNGTIVPGELYYSVSGPYTISSDYTAEIALSSVVVDHQDAVVFEYNVFNNSLFYGGTNDYAIFNSTGLSGPGVSSPAEYVASGSQYTPLGIPSDWEFVMGGPGGGSNLDVISMYSTMDLYYNNSGEIMPVPSAYDVGSETGETSIGAAALWEGNWSPFTEGPGEMIVPGPTFSTGMWNVTNSTQGVGVEGYFLAPSNGFTFLGQTTDPYLFQAYSWAPANWVYFLPPATYSAWSMASNYDPAFNTFSVANNTESLIVVTLATDTFAGVYTPLWALNQSGLNNITWDGYTLYTNQYGPIGYDPQNGLTFPWFGEFNDYTYPVFAGILLWNVVGAEIVAPPSLVVAFPSWDAETVDYFGLPDTNNLPILVYDSYVVTLDNAAAISGWWFSEAEYGPTIPAYDVVFWNTSYSSIVGNTFDTSSNALFLYGGTDNVIYNNTFVQVFPNAPDLLAISGYYFGTYALLEADFGDYYFSGEYCDCWDAIFNNIFDTYFTALSPVYDPYTGGYPGFPYAFSEEWNLPYTPGTNIIGGDYLGGNYWWNYGNDQNPYGYLPYENFNVYYSFIWGLDPYGIYWGGDYLPLTPTPVYTVTFVETGLPAGTEWTPEVEAQGGGYVYNYTNLTYSNESWIGGAYNLSGYSTNPDYLYDGSSTLLVFGNETVFLSFIPLYVVSFEEVGLPTGTEWQVYLEATNYSYLEFNASTGGWVNFSAPAGQYYYGAGADGYFNALDGYGTFNVTGNVTVVIEFVAAYSVTVEETGLPAGTFWTIIWAVTGPESGNGSATVNTSSLFLGYADMGLSISWWVVSPGYAATPPSGSFVLESNTTVSVSFDATTSVTFDASGLAPGAAWTVELTQGSTTTTQTSTAASMTFAGVDGAFSYTVSAAGYIATPPSGSGALPVVGAIDISFAPAPATIVFDASGLAAGTEWTVNFTQDATTTSHTGTGPISIHAVYGSYNYTVSAAGYTATPASGSGVLPSDTPVAISFAPTPASLEFQESGLPSGTPWVVEFTQGGVTTNYTGAGTTIDISAVAGAYSYTVKAANYSASSPTGTGTLPVDATVTETFTVADGTLALTVTPVTATVTVGAQSETLSAGGTYSGTFAPLTYTIKVSAPGYYPYNTTVTIASGKTTTVTVTLKAIPSTPKASLAGVGNEGWLLVAGLGLLVLILLGTTLLFLRRSRSPPQMTQYAGTTPPGGATHAEWKEDAGTSPPGKS